jgi:hypothetical protein
VFSGKVIFNDTINDNPDVPGSCFSGYCVITTIATQKVWKGLVFDTIHVRTTLKSLEDEDYNFEVGKEYLIYAYGDELRLTTTCYTRTKLLSDGKDDIKDLGEGKLPYKKKQFFPTNH